MHERRPAHARDADRQLPAAPASDALSACLSSAGNAAFAGRTPLPRTLGRTPAVAADLELQRALAGTLAREEAPAAAAAGPATAPAGPAATAAPTDPAARERAAFFASCPRVVANHVPSTNIGRFDIQLDPQWLTLTVKVRFVPAGPWTKTQLDKEWKGFQDEWFSTVTKFWRPGLFTFWSQRPGWEDVWVSVNPVFRVAAANEKEHVLVNVHRGNYGSGVDNKTHVAHFGTEDNKAREHAEGERATSTHEAGHLLGLGEEYVDGGAKTTNIEAAHSSLAERQLGHKVLLGSTSSVMSSGGKVFAQHSVTMREALERVAAPYVEWGLKRAAPRSATPTSGPSPAPAASR